MQLFSVPLAFWIALASSPIFVLCNCSYGPSAMYTLIMSYENYNSTPYNDPVGLLTIGYGHRCMIPKCAEVPVIPMTPTTARALLFDDARIGADCINGYLRMLVKDPSPGHWNSLNINQLGALISFAFNIGCPEFRKSTLVKRINAGEDPKKVVPEELPRFVYGTVDGVKVKLAGLVKRRAQEVSAGISGRHNLL